MGLAINKFYPFKRPDLLLSVFWREIRYPPTTFCVLAEPSQIVYTPSCIGRTEVGDVTLAHPELGEWAFEASGIGGMPGVMEEHRAVATVGTTASTMFPFRCATVVKRNRFASTKRGPSISRDGHISNKAKPRC